MFETIEWTDTAVVMLDQRRLPGKEVYLSLKTPEQVAAAIKSMVIRGAPAIGVAAAMGLALGARRIALGLVREPAFRRPSRIDRRRSGSGTPADRRSRETARSRASLVEFQKRFESLGDLFASTRPTAVNLFWAIERMKRVAAESVARAAASGLDLAQPPGSTDPKGSISRKSATRTMVREASPSGSAPTSKVPTAPRSPLAAVVASLVEEARRIKEEDVVACRAIGRHGEPLVPDGARILTHCNAGALATAGYGTALGVVRAAREAGKRIQVLADETRPFLQGARLTAWELLKDGIDTTVITDSMAGYFFKKGEITLAVVGADRIAANGDVANKIGTYQVAVLAKENGVPFYVAAPLSTIDLSIPNGDRIPIEERSPDEVTHAGGARVAPAGVSVRNPAFDVTPNRYVTAIITERGVARAPYDKSLRALFPLTDR